MLSYFLNAYETTPAKSLQLADVVAMLAEPPDEIADAIANLRMEPDEKIQREMKCELPAITFAGQFSQKGETGLIRASGLFVYDFDAVPNVRNLKVLVRDVPSLVLAFTSPRGNGVKVVLRGPKCLDAGEYRAAWRSGRRILEHAAQCEIDGSGTDLARLCFVSHDPKLIHRESPEAFAVDANDAPTFEDFDAIPNQRGGEDFEEYSFDDCRDMLWSVGADIAYDDWRNIIFAVVSRFGRDSAVRSLLEEWSRETGGDKAMQTRKDRANFDAIFESKKSGITFATLIKLAKESGWVDWRKELARDDEGKVKSLESNLRIILRHHPEFRGRFWQDVITGDKWMGPKTDAQLACNTRKGGMLSDEMAFDCVCDLQSMGFPFRGATLVFAAMSALAVERSRNKRAEWLKSLKWDGIKRCEKLFVDAFKANDTPENRALGRAFIAGAAARILSPGSPVQIVPILVGPQGVGKSTALAALCPEREWYCDSIVDVESKAGYEVIRTASIVELSELSAMRRADVEKIKQFLTQHQVKFRGPWERQARTVPASWVFVGTTNRDQFLQDTTGNRRFCPIRCGSNCVPGAPARWIAANRTQLWAEAATIAADGIRNGRESWAVGQEHWEALGIAQEGARVVDPWEDRVREYGARLARGDGSTPKKKMEEIANECGIELRNRGDELHLGDVLRRVGWEKKQTTVGGVRCKRWHLGGF